jgi:hypothetical protein
MMLFLVGFTVFVRVVLVALLVGRRHGVGLFELL